LGTRETVVAILLDALIYFTAPPIKDELNPLKNPATALPPCAIVIMLLLIP